MQIKPFFTSYEELQRIPLFCDDRGCNYSLVIFRGIHGIPCKVCDSRYLKSCSACRFEQYTVYEEARVMSDKLETFANGSTAYEEDLFWKSIIREPKSFIVGSNYGSYELKEVSRDVHNAHNIFGDVTGCATKFEVKSVSFPFFN